MDALDEAILRSGSSAYVAIGSSQNADMRYLTRFSTTDPVVYIRKSGERGLIIVPQMECERAERESPAAVVSRAQAGLLKIMKEEKDRWKALSRMIAGMVEGSILVPPHFPYALGSELEKTIRVEVDRGTLESMRAVKSRGEIEKIRAVQVAAENAIGLAVQLIKKAVVRKGVLHHENSPLTSERVRSAMHRLLLDRGCIASETIVACGKETALPHLRGEGPLREGEPIVIDIFPRDEESGYYSDMTRTVCRGEPAPEIVEMYEAVREAQALADGAIRPGVSGSEVYQAVVDFFLERGYESGPAGFVHSLGHGVGLEVHEAPSLGPAGDRLMEGNVVTNEPGLYFREFGGVRLENIGVLTASGFDTLTRFPENLVV